MEIEKTNFETALLVHVKLPQSVIDTRESLGELQLLAEAAGVEVCGYIRQNRKSPKTSLYVGKGKAEEIGEMAHDKGANVVIFDNDLTPAQIRELEKIIELKVIDRSELILDIFAARASSAEARMQVELAQLEYTYPRLTRMWTHLDTVTAAAASGGVGTRGPGESQLEIDRRLVNNRIASLTRQIKQIDKRKTRQVKSRDRQFTVSLVGYTNAGKSTLMNMLTGAETFVANQLFATLDTKTKRWKFSGNNYVLLSDTVGFVRDLPHHLVASFRATLEETINADLLLHVLDVSHPLVFQQMEAVNKVLGELGCDKKDIILLANKIDRPGAKSACATFTTIHPDAVPICARSGEGMEKLVEIVQSRMLGDRLHLRIVCSQGNGKVPSFLRAHGTIISEEYRDSEVVLEAHLGRRQLARLEQLQFQSCEILSGTLS